MPRWMISISCFVFVLISAVSEVRAEQGAVTCYVFSETRDTPMEGAEVFVETIDSTVTNVHGAARLRLAPGRYIVHVSSPGFRPARIEDVHIVAKEVTEVLVTLSPTKAPTWDIEVAAHALNDAVAAPTADPNAPTGTISGLLKSLDSGESVANARIFVKGYGFEARSDVKGRFLLEIPAGTYTLSVIHPDFSTQSIDGITVTTEQTTAVEIELTPSSVTLADYTVTAPHIEGGVASMLSQRRESSAVADVIGAEQIAKTGDSSAAGALKRVTGLTVVGGKYVYVRGMGERYSSTLLNGATLPSPEPERRVVPLDMFPVGILESVVIQKTYSPDLPGGFGGGTILLKTRGRPESFTLNTSLSTGFKTDTTFRKGLTYSGGKLDFLGIDDGTRALPDKVRQASNSEQLLESDRFSDRGFSAEELETFGESLSNVWSPHRKTVPPDVGLSMTVGDSYQVGQTPMGFLFAASYGNSWDLQKSHRNYYIVGSDDALELKHAYDFESLENNITLGAILDLSTEIAEKHTLKSTTLLIRTTDDEARVYSGYNRDVDTNIRVTRLRWIERMLIVQQLTGSHTFEQAQNLNLGWHYAYSRASRYEPDRRELRFDQESGQPDLWMLSDRPEGNQRLFSDLVDHNHDAGFTFSIPYPIWLDLEASAEAGVNLVWRSRHVDTRRFKFEHKGELSTDVEIISQSPEEIFSPENIGSDGFQFQETTRQTDNYKADGQLFAGYLKTDLPLLASLLLMVGFRVEHSSQSVTTYELFNPDNAPVEANVRTTDVLPAATLTWKCTDDMQLRAGYGMTVSRPDFRELSPATFNDVTGGRQIFGNPDLERTKIHNLDLRYEYYFSTLENVSLALFYKDFSKPIETVVVPSAQQSVTYANAKGAQNLGAELEFRKNFSFFADVLKDLSLSGNIAYIQSRIRLAEDSGIQTSNNRPLQGQSPYVVNAQLGYDNEDWGTSLTLVYNVFGPRIVEVGAQGAPDVIEQPFHQLDFVAMQKLPAGFSLKLKLKNLIDPPVRYVQGSKTTNEYHRGLKVSLDLGWSY